jgi:hypothetical protein
MRTGIIVDLLSGFQFLTGVVQHNELMDVAEFIAQPPQSCQIRALRSAVIEPDELAIAQVNNSGSNRALH